MKGFYKAVSIIMALAVLAGAVNALALAAPAGGIKIDGDTFFEAEDASTMNSPMTVYTDSTASGSVYTAPASGSSSMTSPAARLRAPCI